MKRTFIYTDDKSSKFWAIETDGAAFTVTFGKTGTDGQKSEKSFASDAECQKAADKLIAEKTKKGYVEQSVATADDEDDNGENGASGKLPYQFDSDELTFNVDVSDTAKIETTLQGLVDLMDDEKFLGKLYDDHPVWIFLDDDDEEVWFFDEAVNQPELHPLLEQFGRKLIAANNQYCELTCENYGDQTAFGTEIFSDLARADIKYIPLYKDLLHSIDLDNEVEEGSQIDSIARKWGWCAETLPLIVARYFSLSGQHGRENVEDLLIASGNKELADSSELRSLLLNAVAKETRDYKLPNFFEAAFPWLSDAKLFADRFIQAKARGDSLSFELLSEGIALNREKDDSAPVDFAPETLFKTETLPDGTLKITGLNDEEEFEKLKTVAFPPTINGAKVKEISAIYDENETVERIIIPEHVEKIHSYAFSKYKKLKSIVLPEGLKELGEMVFFECKLLEEIHIPNTVRNNCSNVFQSCISLKHANIPDTWTVLPEMFFDGCRLLEEILLPPTMETIGTWALAQTKLKTLVLPKNVRTIKDYAFKDCSSLETVIVESPTVVTIDAHSFIDGDNIFSGIAPDAVLKVPADLVEQYAAIDNWRKNFKRIEAIKIK